MLRARQSGQFKLQLQSTPVAKYIFPPWESIIQSIGVEPLRAERVVVYIRHQELGPPVHVGSITAEDPTNDLKMATISRTDRPLGHSCHPFVLQVQNDVEMAVRRCVDHSLRRALAAVHSSTSHWMMFRDPIPAAPSIAAVEHPSWQCL
jgi:hypothetical protein